MKFSDETTNEIINVIGNIKNMINEAKSNYSFFTIGKKWYELNFKIDNLDTMLDMLPKDDDRIISDSDDLDDDDIDWIYNERKKMMQKGLSVITEIIGEREFEQSLQKHINNSNINVEEWDFAYSKPIVPKNGKKGILNKIEVYSTSGDTYIFDAMFMFNEKTNMVDYSLTDIVYDRMPEISLEEGKKSNIYDVYVNNSNLEQSIEDVLIPYLESFFKKKKIRVDMIENNAFNDENEDMIEYIINGVAKKKKNQVIWTNNKLLDYDTYQEYTFDFIATFKENGQVDYEVSNLGKSN